MSTMASLTTKEKSVNSLLFDYKEEELKDRKTNLYIKTAFVIAIIAAIIFQAYTGTLTNFQFASLEGGLGVVMLFTVFLKTGNNPYKIDLPTPIYN